MKMAVAVATVGRAPLTCRTVAALQSQERRPDRILVIGAAPADVEGVAEVAGAPEVLLAERGSCAQRNRAIELLGSDIDVIVFLDDDLVPAPDYLAVAETLLTADPTLVGLTGHLLADGARGEGFTYEEALELVATRPAHPDPALVERTSLYGCNMVVRASAIRSIRFDTNLPLYGWQEDIDFSTQLRASGHLAGTALLTGVHMGAKGGRTSGLRFGYSQIANTVYLVRKGTMRRKFAYRLLASNLAANILRSFAPEAHIDRRGRLRGNLIALGHLATGRIDPRHILRL